MPPAFVDPVFLGLLAVFGLIFFLGYLLIRRTMLAFREGTRRGKNR